MSYIPKHINASYISNFLNSTEANNLYRNILNTTSIQKLSLEHQTGKVMFVTPDVRNNKLLQTSVWGEIQYFPDYMTDVKKKVENSTKNVFHICVCLYYPNGLFEMGYHSDLPAFGDTNIISSLSLGAERTFMIKEKSNEKEYKIILQEGSLFVMKTGFQERFEHSLPKEPECYKARINLTFRKFGY